MTEQEWLARNDPKPKLEYLHGKVSDRKLRLFACGYARLSWSLLPEPENGKQRNTGDFLWAVIQPDTGVWSAVEVSERYADGLASKQELTATVAAASQAAHWEQQQMLRAYPDNHPRCHFGRVFWAFWG